MSWQLKPVTYRCPTCGSDDQLRIEVTQFRRLFPSGAVGMLGLERPYTDGGSQVGCEKCGHHAPRDFFMVQA